MSRERRRHLLAACMAVYALVLVAAPLEHHDLLCHLRTPAHCTSCASSPPGSNTLQLKAPGARDLVDAGRALTYLPAPQSVIALVPSTGRAPPSQV